MIRAVPNITALSTEDPAAPVDVQARRGAAVPVDVQAHRAAAAPVGEQVHRAEATRVGERARKGAAVLVGRIAHTGTAAWAQTLMISSKILASALAMTGTISSDFDE